MQDLQRFLTEQFRVAIVKAFGEAHASVDPVIRPAANPKFGDYQANLAMSLAKVLGAKPRDIATKIVDALDRGEWAEKFEIAGPGFINVHLRTAFLGERVSMAARDERIGVAPAAIPETVVVDYSAPNVAKEMHVGHLRSTIIGDCIARTLEFLGHSVIRQNHLGDWGTQFGMLIEHMIEVGWDGPGERSIRDLNVLYKDSKKKFDADPAFAERSRARVVLLQGGDAKTLTLWRVLIAQSQVHFNDAYRRLGVKLTDDDVRGESFYNDRLAPTVAELEAKGLARENDGALCVFPAGFKREDGEPLPLLIRKTGGGFLYATTDLAALRYRLTELRANRLVYVTDARQKQHFAMVFEVARMAGWITSEVRVEHVPFGMVLGEDGKPFKARSGESVRLSELLDEAQERARGILAEKKSDLDAATRENVASVVGIGAIKYTDLSNDRVKDYVFSWERMLSFDGNTAPYLQNAYVRIRSIFRRANLTAAPLEAVVDPREPAERTLALTLMQFPTAVGAVAESLEPHRMCGYLYDLAAGFHSFYEHCSIKDAPDEATRSSRLVLCDLTARTLARGLGLLGIGVVEQM
ncbi:MAG: arginine--tRNA ligase [Deltaproteobacteria bacterium]